MYLVHVYPLVRGTPLQTLTYFSKITYPRSAVIDVPIRRTATPAVVARTQEVAAARAEIRRAPHKILHTPAQESRFLFLPAFLDAAERLASETVGSVGAILHSLIPASLLTHSRGTYEVPHTAGAHGAHFEELLLQAPRTERMSAYRTLVREQFAQKRSLLLITPSVREAQRCVGAIREGLPADRIHLIHSALGARAMRAAWHAALSAREPIAIVTTLSGIGIPRNDLGIIVIEREQTDYYIREARPRTDVREFAANYARALSVPILFADSVLGVSRFVQLECAEAAEYRPFKTHTEQAAPLSIIDMRDYKKGPRDEFRTLSDELLALVKKVEHEKSHLFILSGRRGLASSLICKDCGATVLCPHCESPVALYMRKDVPTFLCRRCNALGESAARCASCSSWNLLALGAGSELIEKQLKSVTRLPLLRLDSDSAKTPKASAALVKLFEEKSSILVGTEQAVPYLPDRIPHIALSAIDSLLAVPDFAVNERLFSMLVSLRERAERSILVQTRNPKHPTLLAAMSGDVREFQRRELRERRAFGFPPYSALISIARFGPKHAVVKDIARLSALLAVYKPTLLPTQKGAQRGSSIVLSIPRDKWPNHELLALLRPLAPTWDITIRS